MNITDLLTDCVTRDKPISFIKYGDGEFLCAFHRNGSNCDNDTYTNKLGDSIINSFIYMVEHSENSYIGLWHNLENKTRWEQIVNKNVKWVDYHSILIDDNNINNLNKLELYKSIKYSKRKKIIICNELLIKSKLLLNLDEVIMVPFNNWFDSHFEELINILNNMINTDNNHIVITCCGMSAKVLICELYKKFPNGIYLDFGSGLDLICTKKNSRGHNHDYDFVKDLLKELLPDDWEDSKYDYIYENAKVKLGIHL